VSSGLQAHGVPVDVTRQSPVDMQDEQEDAGVKNENDDSYLQAVLEQRLAPAQDNDRQQRLHPEVLQMVIPCMGCERVAWRLEVFHGWRRGSVIVLAIAVLALLFIIASTLLVVSSQQRQAAEQALKDSQLRAVSEALTQSTLIQLRNDLVGDNEVPYDGR